MPIATVRLYYPSDTFGRLICWRLESDYSHATIEFNGTIYSATFPKVAAVPLTSPAFGMPPRQGRAFDITLTDDEYAKAEAWFKAQVGTDYDVLAMLGWAFRVSAWQSRKRVYCFESVYACLAAAGVFPTSKLLVTGDQLLVDALSVPSLHVTDREAKGSRLARIMATSKARLQKAPVSVG